MHYIIHFTVQEPESLPKMPARNSREDKNDGKDRIPVEQPDSSDINMVDGQYFDQIQRPRSAYDNSHAPARQPMFEDSRYSDHQLEPEDTRRHSSSPRPYRDFIPGLSSLDRPAETAEPQHDTRSPREAPLHDCDNSFVLPPRSRRRTPSPRASSFTASQATTLHDRPPPRFYGRPPSSIRERPARTRRSRSEERSRGRSRCRNLLALTTERQRHGSDFRLAWLRRPTGEVAVQERIVVATFSDDGKERRGRSGRKR